MKKILKTMPIILIILLISNQLYSSDMLERMDSNSESKKTKYNIEETSKILQSSKLGKIKLDYDDHVYKAMKISQKASDLDGAADVLVESKIKLGSSLDDIEVDAIIEISKLNTNLYREIMISARKIGKKKTTIKEHFNIIEEFKKGNGEYLLTGISHASGCNYKIENDYFSRNRLKILIQLGNLKDENKLFDVYSAMRIVGMDRNVNSKGLEVLYELCKLEGDVANIITTYLKYNKWRSRTQPGEREYIVIKDLINSHYQAAEENSDFDEADIAAKPVELKVVESEKPKVRRAKKRSYAKKTKSEKAVFHRPTDKKHLLGNNFYIKQEK